MSKIISVLSWAFVAMFVFFVWRDLTADVPRPAAIFWDGVLVALWVASLVNDAAGGLAHHPFYRWQITKRLAFTLKMDCTVTHPKHGPESWPWWRLVSVRAYRTNDGTPKAERQAHPFNVWAYTRWGAWCWHVAMDRRALPAMVEVGQ